MRSFGSSSRRGSRKCREGDNRVQHRISNGGGQASHLQWRSRTGGRVCNRVQVILEDEDEGGDSRRTSSMGPLICIERISGCMEGEHNGGIRNRRDRI